LGAGLFASSFPWRVLLVFRIDAEKEREHAAEIDRLAEQQKQLEEEQRLLADVEAAADMYARKRRADVRRKTMASVRSLKQAILQGRAPAAINPVKPLFLANGGAR
jgi:membrane protein involved in colicin uptake